MEKNDPVRPLGIKESRTNGKVTKKVSMLTTFDNPFDPFEDFARWFVFDSEKGYNTCGLLAIVSGTSDSFIEEVNDDLNEEAIDSIIENDFLNIYKKITKEVVDE